MHRPQPRYDKYPQDRHDSAPGIRYQTGNKAANGKSAQSWDWGDGWGIFVYGFGTGGIVCFRRDSLFLFRMRVLALRIDSAIGSLTWN